MNDKNAFNSSSDVALPLFKRVSWAAVFAGVVVTLVVQLGLGLLSLAFGAGRFSPLTEENPFTGLGLGSGMWLLISTMLSLYAGGWIAGHFAGIPKRVDSTLHGVLAWAFASVVSFYVLASVLGGVLGGAAGLLGRGLSAAGQGVVAVAPKVADVVEGQAGVDLSTIQREVRALAAEDPAAAAELSASIARMFSRNGELQAGDREALISALSNRTGITPPEAAATVDRWQEMALQARAQFNETRAAAEQRAREVADATAKGISSVAFWSFVALLFGGLAAALGGKHGMPKDIDVPRGAYQREPVTGRRAS